MNEWTNERSKNNKQMNDQMNKRMNISKYGFILFFSFAFLIIYSV